MNVETKKDCGLSARWFIVWLILLPLYGCVAQQADVVRIKRELDAKIHLLDKSKTALQEAVAEANKALGNANLVISKQRAEIKELLHARAELMDQMATLKETDLSQVRGAIDANQHQVNELSKRFGLMEIEFQALRNQAQESQAALEPLVGKVQERLGAGEQLLTEQGGKLGEFRTSLVDYQEALAAVRETLAKQDQQLNMLQAQYSQVVQSEEAKEKRAQANFEEVKRSIQSIIGTLEKVSTTFGKRLDEHEYKLNRVAGLKNPSMNLGARSIPTDETSSQLSNARPPLISHSPLSSPLTLPTTTSPTNQLGNTGDQVEKVERIKSPDGSASTLLSSFSKPATTSRLSAKEMRDPREQYEAAFKLLRQGQYVGAAEKFSTFLRVFSESPLASNAQYWLGECYYGQRRFAEAIDEFERVFMLYPESPKVPASLLKIGYSHLELQDPATAQSVFHQLVRTYPQSPEASKAQNRLQEVSALLRNPS